MSNVAFEVVERARAGDQVAMAIMAEVRDNAKKGDRLARHNKKLIDEYIEKHPPSQMGVDQLVLNTNKLIGANKKAMAALWTAPMEKFAEVFIKASPFVSMWQGVVCVVHRASLDAKDPLVLSTNVKNSRMGAIVRKATKMRSLRNRTNPISIYCRATGWELGE
jgi:hypothetical protein